MAATKKTKAVRASIRASRRKSQPSPAAQDAISLLEADHREVEGWFEAYEGLESDADKKAMASRICLALKVHTQIEASGGALILGGRRNPLKRW